MPTDLPYAADAEVSLSYDELEVIHPRTYKNIMLISTHAGSALSVQEGGGTISCERADQVQLRLGSCQVSTER
jgi:hypothetical protein